MEDGAPEGSAVTMEEGSSMLRGWAMMESGKPFERRAVVPVATPPGEAKCKKIASEEGHGRETGQTSLPTLSQTRMFNPVACSWAR